MQGMQGWMQNIHSETLQGRLRQASAARPQRRERQQMKRANLQSHSSRDQPRGSVEALGSCSEGSSLPGHATGESYTPQFHSDGDQDLTDQNIASKEATLQEALADTIAAKRTLEQQIKEL